MAVLEPRLYEFADPCFVFRHGFGCHFRLQPGPDPWRGSSFALGVEPFVRKVPERYSLYLPKFTEPSLPIGLHIESDLHRALELGDIHLEKLPLKSLHFQSDSLRIVELVE